MNVQVLSLWQQKHPTPTNGNWEFHWHPTALPVEVTDTVAAMDLGLGGEAQGAFVVGKRFALWLRTFSAQVPSEQRSYTGLAGVMLRPISDEPDDAWADALPAALAQVTLPAAEPASQIAASIAKMQVITAEPAHVLPIRDEDWPASLPRTVESAHELARILAREGRARLSPADDQLAALAGRLLSWIPARDRLTPRRATFAADATPSVAESPSVENLLHYLAVGWTATAATAELARATFELIGDLVATLSRSSWDLFGALTSLANAWDSAASLAAYLRGVLTADELAACDAAAPAPLFTPDEKDAGMLWNRVLHYWGRDFLRGAGMERRLAVVLACRILVDHLVALDGAEAELPRRYLRRLRYEALLSAAKVQAMTAELARVLPGGAR